MMMRWSMVEAHQSQSDLFMRLHKSQESIAKCWAIPIATFEEITFMIVGVQGWLAHITCNEGNNRGCFEQRLEHIKAIQMSTRNCKIQVEAWLSTNEYKLVRMRQSPSQLGRMKADKDLQRIMIQSDDDALVDGLSTSKPIRSFHATAQITGEHRWMLSNTNCHVWRNHLHDRGSSRLSKAHDMQWGKHSWLLWTTAWAHQRQSGVSMKVQIQLKAWLSAIEHEFIRMEQSPSQLWQMKADKSLQQIMIQSDDDALVDGSSTSKPIRSFHATAQITGEHRWTLSNTNCHVFRNHLHDRGSSRLSSAHYMQWGEHSWLLWTTAWTHQSHPDVATQLQN